MKKSIWIFVVVMLLSLCMAAFSACSVGGDSGNTKPDSSTNSESYQDSNISGDDEESESVSETQSESESEEISESESGENSESESKSESGEESVHTHKFERNADERYLKSAATCEKRAEYYFSCKCGEMGMQTFEYGDLLPHTEVIDEAIKATCTSAGISAGKHCSVCNKVLEVPIVIPALGHDLAMHEGKASTCTEKGFADYETCRRCDYTNYRELPLAEHELENGICKNCGKEITPHNHIEVIDEGKPATCLESGLTSGKHCSICNKILEEQQVIPALGHDTISHDGKAATCTEAGYNAYEICSRCDYTTYTVIPALGHDLTYYNGKEATCTEEGYEDYETCSRCDYTTYRKIDALGHDWKETIIIEDGKAICEVSYFVGNKCTRCNFLDESSVVAREPAEHIVAENGWKLDRTPTLTKLGIITGICETCNKTVAMEIPAVNYEDYNIDGDISICNENGFEVVASLKVHVYIEFAVTVPAKKHIITLSDGMEHEVSLSNVITITEEDVSSGCIQLFGNIAPTCDEQGVPAIANCEVCDARLMITVRFNHVPFTEEGIQAAAESHYTSCVDIGHSGEFSCMYCRENVRLKLPELGHEFEYKIEANPVVAAGKQTFRVTKICERNMVEGYDYNCDYSMLINVAAEGMLVDRKDATCSEEGYLIYEFCISGDIIMARVNLPKTQHYVSDGEKLIYIDDGLTINYDKFIEEHGEGLIFLFDNVKPTCTTLVYGRYVCAQCGSTNLISLIGSHKKLEDPAKITYIEATCTTPEIISYICQYEDHNEEVIEEVGAPLGHDLVYTYDEESKVIVASCVRKYECGREDTFMDVTEIKIKDPDCCTPKEITYIGENGCEVVYRVGNPVHSLTNAKGETYLAPEKDENGNDIIYTVDNECIFAFENNPACSGDDGVVGYYICAVCGKTILVKVRAAHKKIDGTEKIIKAATCVENGEMTYRCSTCDPNNNLITEPIHALGHDLVYRSVIEGDTVIVIETCGREGCSLEEKRTTIGNINNSELIEKDIERSKPATCTIKGIDVYKFYYVNICGGTVIIEVHVIAEKLNHSEYYVETSWKKEGVIYYGYYCEKCDQYIITRTETEA